MKKSTTLVLKTTTWSRESHGLFDYESTNTSNKILKAISSANIVRIQNDIQLVVDNDINIQNSNVIAVLKRRQDGYFSIMKPKINKNEMDNLNSDNIWMIVKSISNTSVNTKPKGHILTKDDVIKLGRMKFRVKDINILANSPKNDSCLDSPNHELIDNIENKMEIDQGRCLLNIKFEDLKSSEFGCRICLSNDNYPNDIQNLLISPCACSGSVKYVHLSCLKLWIKSKGITKNGNNCVNYVWKTLECELCHKMLPEIFCLNGKQIDLIDIPKPETSYLILENISKEKQIARIYHVITLPYDNVIKIGRGHDCNIRLNDISVSRCHAFIKMENGQFYLEDNDSKFGTLIQIKDSLRLNPDINPEIQIGRTVISFSMKIKTIPFFCNPMNEVKGFKKFLQFDKYDQDEFIFDEKTNIKSDPWSNFYGNYHFHQRLLTLAESQRRMCNKPANDKEFISDPKVNQFFEKYENSDFFNCQNGFFTKKSNLKSGMINGLNMLDSEIQVCKKIMTNENEQTSIIANNVLNALNNVKVELNLHKENLEINKKYDFSE